MIPGQRAFGKLKARGDWFPRQADNARFSFQKIDDSGATVSAATLTIRVVHKNSEDPGDGTLTVTPAIVLDDGTTTGSVETAEFNGLLELVRFEYDCAGNADEWLQFQQLQPVWFDTPNA